MDCTGSRFQMLRSSRRGAKPKNLAPGEPAVNLEDGRFFIGSEGGAFEFPLLRSANGLSSFVVHLAVGIAVAAPGVWLVVHGGKILDREPAPQILAVPIPSPTPWVVVVDRGPDLKRKKPPAVIAETKQEKSRW